MRFQLMLLVSSAAALCVMVGITTTLRGDVADEQVTAAINRGVEYLLKQQKADGLFAKNIEFKWSPAGGSIRGGEDAWVLVGLAIAEVSMNREEMKRALKAVMNIEMDKTYSVSARLIALSRLYNKVDRELRPRLRRVIRRDIEWLKTAQGAEGQWDYNSLKGASSRHWDFSNTQMAILALSEAAMAGFELPEETLLRAQKLYLEWQVDDGGWAYGSRPVGGNRKIDDSYGSMTAAAVASLYITRNYLYRGLGCPCSGGKSKLRPNKVDTAIRRGEKWLGEKFEAKGGSYYWLYSCERVGLAAGLKYFGSHNWYVEGATYIVSRQQDDGHWQIQPDQILSDTVFAICFLVKGRAPILLNKLQFDGQWDNHSRDAANLARYVGHVKEQSIAWQVINLEAPVDEWHDAPIVYITAETPIPLTAEQKARLRRFTDTGGTILFEASCGNRAMDKWWRTACAEIWPEWELKLIEKEHPLWTADLKLVGRLPQLYGCFDGVRTFIIYSARDVSCRWHTMAITKHRLLFDLGCNLYAYTTDRGKLRARLSANRVGDRDVFKAATIAPAGRSTLRVRLMKHGGDWYISRHYRPLEILAAYLKDRGGQLTLEVGEAIVPSDDAAGKTDVLWLTGRKGLTLSDDEAAALKKWLAGGGYLVAEACMGDAAFDRQFQALARTLGLEVRTAAPDDPLVTGSAGGATGFKLKPLHFTSSLKAARIGAAHAELSGLYLDGKLVGIYSPLDVSLGVVGVKSFGNRGYAPTDARAVATNLLLPATAAEARGTGSP